MTVQRKKAFPRYLNRSHEGDGQCSFPDRYMLDNFTVPDNDRKYCPDGDIDHVIFRADESWSRNMYPASDG